MGKVRRVGIMKQQVQLPPVMMPASQTALFGVPVALLLTQLPAPALRKAAKIAQVLGLLWPVEDRDGVSCFQLWPGPVLAFGK